MIDEAQNLTLPLIEETRILSDSFGAEGRLQIVFVGQPELHAKLKLPEMRQVDQRVCGYHRLSPMSRAAVEGYIQHRLVVAGGRPDRVLFSPDIMQRLHLRTGGVPRLINRVCDRALQMAFEQKAERVDRVTLEAALNEIGSAMLSPTWDAIMAEAPAPQPEPAPKVIPPVAPPPSAPEIQVPPIADVETAPAQDDAEDFQKEVAQWVSRDLAPPARKLSPVFAEVTPEQLRAWRRSPRSASAPAAPVRNLKLDWPDDVRSETVVQRLLRVWTKRLAMAAALGAVIVVATKVIATQAPVPMIFEGATIPHDAPTRVAAIPPIETPAGNGPTTEAAPDQAPMALVPVAQLPLAAAPVVQAPLAQAVPSAPAAVAGNYLVGVGLFSSQARADQLVDVLTQAGLPVMQRPFQMRQREVQQIVLGPFFSRADAVADLQRLKALGGYDDATVIDASRQAPR